MDKVDYLDKERGIERLLWSIAFPGFGQFLNGSIVKGLCLLLLEIYVNNLSNLNSAIIMSFKGDIPRAIEEVKYQYLMFYPCIYTFAIWDAYKNARSHAIPYIYLPFILAAYAGTICVIYSSSFRIKGVLLGPVWLPILGLISGSLLGVLLRLFLIRYNKLQIKT
jgi:hypothetical protein